MPEIVDQLRARIVQLEDELATQKAQVGKGQGREFVQQSWYRAAGAAHCAPSLALALKKVSCSDCRMRPRTLAPSKQAR